MAQAGIHGMVGTAVRRWTPDQTLLMTGIVLGNLFPDLDNFAVAIATLTGSASEGLHRSFTHSLFAVIAVWVLFIIIGAATGQTKWRNFGIGFGIGMIMHILLDIFIWFGHVQILWPLAYDVNIWANVTPPDWWMKLMMPAEFLFFALFFWVLMRMAQQQQTNSENVRTVKVWTAVQIVLFVIFTALVYVMESGFMTIYGAAYLFSLVVAWIIVIKMRQTVEWRESKARLRTT